MKDLHFVAKTKELIDSLKSVCANYGLGNEDYFVNRAVLKLTGKELEVNQSFELNSSTIKHINNLIAGEYLGQFRQL